MIKRYILNVMGIAAGVLLSACEPEPHHAVADARSALEKAEKAGAGNWAPAQLKRGHALFDSAMKELAVEKRKLPFNRSYRQINELLDIAAEAGHYALEAMQAGNERIRVECRERLDRAKHLADSLDGVLKAAVEHKKNVGSLPAALDSARMAQEEASAVLDSGDMFLAEEKAMWAGNKTEDVAKNIAELLSPLHKARNHRSQR